VTKRVKKQIIILLKAGIVMAFGLLIFKYIPMQIWGDDILFDASAHITGTIFVLYVFWFFIDQNEKWRIPFFFLSGVILAVVAFQRIEVNAHNDIGLLAGFIVSISAIIYSQYDKLKDRFEF
jgi:membrane-associated phospholipid phosphatase